MAARYLDLLSDADLRLLAEASDTVEPDRAARWFRLAPQELDTALAEERTYEHLFGRTSAPTGIITASPTLLFAVLIHRAAAEIADAPYISERVGGRQLVPVFDSVTLAEFAASAEHRVFLVELLGSYTKVVSGPTLVRQDGRWRRRRFSEMSPTQLAGLLDTVEEAERPGVYRRLGDLALFVTGIFPDHAAQQPIGPVDLTRLLRSLPPSERSDVLANEPESVFGRGTTAAVLGGFGPRWYRVASELTPLPTVARPLSEMAGSFDHARRFLTFLTDRHLFDTRSWFPFSWN